MIRRFCALATVAMLVLLAAACGGSGSTSTATTPKKAATANRTITPAATAALGGTPGATASHGGGDGGTGGDATPASPTVANTQPPPITGYTTSYTVTFTVASDPGSLQPLFEYRQRLPTHIAATVSTSGQIAINAGRPIIRVTGTIDGSGNFSATGSGTVDPYRDVGVTFTGTIATDGSFTGSYAIGTNGTLPGGGVLTYTVTGRGPAGRTPAATQTP